MNIVIAIDSFKGSLSSAEAGKAAAEGIRRVMPDAVTKVYPVSDGGEGVTEILANAIGGVYRQVNVTDPLGRRMIAKYAVVHDDTAIIEMAAAAGLPLLSVNERDPMVTTTYGVGEMIADAVRSGIRKFIIGIGGSATNDGGIGCLQALGFGMFNKEGVQVGFGAQGLSELYSIDETNKLPGLDECSFSIACDVEIPLCGPNGASYVFASQKGASTSNIPLMDEWMKRYAEMTKKLHPDSSENAPGTGAAGGLGFALTSYLNGELLHGIELAMRTAGIDKAIETADIVVTGEGCIDRKSTMGKVTCGVAEEAKKYGIPVIAFSGIIDENVSSLKDHGVTACFPIIRKICSRDYAMDVKNAYRNLADTAEQVFSLIEKTGTGA